mmetsp:Transcript_12032/g.28138  ORF Transcript_12032/g.28138 Transcript_12032/m.28138 type:complete len:200 (-) Transcript_12032:151-750(-)
MARLLPQTLVFPSVHPQLEPYHDVECMNGRMTCFQGSIDPCSCAVEVPNLRAVSDQHREGNIIQAQTSVLQLLSPPIDVSGVCLALNARLDDLADSLAIGLNPFVEQDLMPPCGSIPVASVCTGLDHRIDHKTPIRFRDSMSVHYTTVLFLCFLQSACSSKLIEMACEVLDLATMTPDALTARNSKEEGLRHIDKEQPQ